MVTLRCEAYAAQSNMASPPTPCKIRETAGMSSVMPETLLAAEKQPRMSG